MLFLTDVNHVSYGKANETRQINLPSATASLQVVIGLCKRKETAALKFKAAASYRRVDRTAVRRLFFFCRRPADIDKTYISYDLLDCSFSSATHLIMCAFCSDENRMVFIARVYASASLLF